MADEPSTLQEYVDAVTDNPAGAAKWMRGDYIRIQTLTKERDEARVGIQRQVEIYNIKKRHCEEKDERIAAMERVLRNMVNLVDNNCTLDSVSAKQRDEASALASGKE